MHSFETFSFFLSSFLRQIAFAAASLPPRRIRYTERQRALPRCVRSAERQIFSLSPSFPKFTLAPPPSTSSHGKDEARGRAGKREPLLPSREGGGLSLRSEARTVSLRHPAKRARGAFTKSPKFKAQIAARNRRTERGLLSLSLASARRVDYRTNSFRLKNSPLSSPSLRSSVPSPAESLSRQYYCTIVERAAEERSKKRERERGAPSPLSPMFPSSFHPSLQDFSPGSSSSSSASVDARPAPKKGEEIVERRKREKKNLPPFSPSASAGPCLVC